MAMGFASAQQLVLLTTAIGGAVAFVLYNLVMLRRRSPDGTTSEHPDSLTVLATLPTEVEAALIVSHLAEQGIKAHIGGPRMGYPVSLYVQVVVRPEDFARAKELLGLVHRPPRTNEL